MYKIVFHKDKNGKNEVEEYIEMLKLKKEQDKNSRIKYNKIVGYMEYLTNEGIKIGEPFIKHLEYDLWELRPLKDRILFGYIEDNKFIILSRFIKQTQKTPRREIKRAYKLLNEYKEEKKNEKKR